MEFNMISSFIFCDKQKYHLKILSLWAFELGPSLSIGTEGLKNRPKTHPLRSMATF